MKRIPVMLLVAMTVLLLVPTSSQASRKVEISITDTGLVPGSVEIVTGRDYIWWANNSSESVWLYSGSDCTPDGTYSSFISPGGHYQYSFPAGAGTYSFYIISPFNAACSSDPIWSGTVVVKDLDALPDLTVPLGTTVKLPPGKHVFRYVTINGHLVLTGNTEIVAWGRSDPSYIDTSITAFDLDSGAYIECDLPDLPYAVSGSYPDMGDDGEANGRDGQNCTSGGAGSPGNNGYDLTLTIYGRGNLAGDLDLSGQDGRNGGSCSGGEDGHACSMASPCPSDCAYCAGGNGGNGANGGPGGRGGNGGDLKVTCFGPLYIGCTSSTGSWRGITTVGGEGGHGQSACAAGSGNWAVHACSTCADMDYDCLNACNTQAVEYVEGSVSDGRHGTGSGAPGLGGDGGQVSIWATSITGCENVNIRTQGGRGGTSNETVVPIDGIAGVPGGSGGDVSLEAQCLIDGIGVYSGGGAGGSGSKAGYTDHDTCEAQNGGQGSFGGQAGNVTFSSKDINDYGIIASGGDGGNGGDARVTSETECRDEDDHLVTITSATGGGGGPGGSGGSVTVQADLGLNSGNILVSGGNGGTGGEGITPGGTGADGSGGSSSLSPRYAEAADISISAPEKIQAGGVIQYMITVTPLGEDLDEATVTVRIPSQTTFSQAYGQYERNRNLVTWTLRNLVSCQPTMVTLTVNVDSDAELGSLLTNQAWVQWSGTSPILSDEITTEITLDGSLDLVVHDNPDPVLAGQDLAYKIYIYNNLNSDIHDTTLTVRFSADLTPGDGLAAVAEIPITYIEAGEVHVETVTATADETLNVGDQFTSEFEVVNSDFGKPVSASTTVRSTVGQFQIEVLEPSDYDAPNPGNSQDVRGFLTTSLSGVDYTRVLLEVKSYSSNPYDGGLETLVDTKVNYSINSDWTFEVPMRLGDLDNRIVITVLLDGNPVGVKDDVYCQAEFFKWYYHLLHELAWSDQRNLITPDAEGYADLDSTTAEKLTETVYRLWLVWRLHRTASSMYAQQDLDLLVDLVGDLVNPFEIIQGALGSSGKWVAGKAKTLAPNLFNRTAKSLRDVSVLDYMSYSGGHLFSDPTSAKGEILGHLSTGTVDEVNKTFGQTIWEITGRLPNTQDDWFLETTSSVVSKGAGLKEYCSNAFSGAVTWSYDEFFQTVVDLVLWQMMEIAHDSSLDVMPGSRDGALTAYQEAVTKMTEAANSWIMRKLRNDALNAKALAKDLETAGIATLGVGAATIWAAGAGSLGIAVGDFELALAEMIGKSTLGTRGIYLALMLDVLVNTYGQGSLGIYMGEPIDLSSHDGTSSFRVEAANFTSVRTTLNALKTQAQAGGTISDQLNAYLDTLDSFDLENSRLLFRLKAYTSGLPWLTDQPNFPEVLELPFAFSRSRAAEASGRAAVLTMAVAYEIEPIIDNRDKLVEAIDDLLNTYLTDLEGYSDQAETALTGAGSIAGVARIHQAGFDGEFIAGAPNTLNITLLNPGDQAARDVVVTLTENSSDISLNTETVRLGDLAAGATATASFTVQAAVGYYPWALKVKVSSLGQTMDSLGLTVEAVNAHSTQTIGVTGGQVTAGEAVLTIPEAGLSVDTEMMVIPEMQPLGYGPDYAPAGTEAYRLFAKQGDAFLSDLPPGSTLTVNYTVPTGFVESDLGLFFFNPATEAWEDPGAVQDTAGKSFTTGVAKTGLYAVLAPRFSGPAFDLAGGSEKTFVGWSDGLSPHDVYRFPNSTVTYDWTLVSTSSSTYYAESQSWFENGKVFLYKVLSVDANGNRSQAGTIIPVITHSDLDMDQDGMPDDWETVVGLDATLDDSQLDPDQDGLANIDEYGARGAPFLSGYMLVCGDPLDPDTDNGGEPDGSEIAAGRNPSNPLDDVVPASHTGSITGTVFLDLDGDGTMDDGETGLAGLPVTLEGEGGPWQTSTNSSGEYTFANLEKGYYTLEVTEQAPIPDWASLTEPKRNPFQIYLVASGVSLNNVGYQPPPDQGYLMTVTKSGFGTGEVSSTPAAVDCGFDCTQYFAPGTPVTLEAAPHPDTTFAGWTGDCSGTGDCTLVMDGNHTVGASFTGVDTNHNGLPDGWEKYYFNELLNDVNADTDHDGLSHLQEYQHGTDPTNSDTDGDGMEDGWEVMYGLNPLVNDSYRDRDNDGIANIWEYQLNSDPADPESYPGTILEPTAHGQQVVTLKNKPVDITLTGSDPAGMPLTYSVVADPAHGTLTGTPPNLTYTPDQDYRGPDSFTFKVNNYALDSDEAAVTLTMRVVVMVPNLLLLLD